jgi:hypothetical protein
MKKYLVGLLAFLPALSYAGPNILANSDHFATVPAQVISNLGGIATTVDFACSVAVATCLSNQNTGTFDYFTFVTFAQSATSGSQSFYQANTSTVDSGQQPYTLLTSSTASYTTLFEQQNYGVLAAAGVIFNTAGCPGAVAANDYPPVASTTILPDNIPTQGAWTGVPNNCGYSANIEFSLAANANYNTGSPSGSVASLAGILAVMKQNHPSWTWQDIKGALRQTASNWSGGWELCATCGTAGSGFGYGDVNFVAANDISSPSAIYLQPPGMVVGATPPVSGNVATYTITVYPFLQTRRVNEVVYVGGTWPSPATGCGGSTCNEYTAAQIAAAGGQACVSNGIAVTPTFTCEVSLPSPPSQGTIAVTSSFVAVTLDANGNGSRVESFMPQIGAIVVVQAAAPPVVQPVISGQQAAIYVASVVAPLLLF